MSEPVKGMQASMKNWRIDVGNLVIRHKTGLTVKFEYFRDGDCIGRIIEGHPQYDADRSVARSQAEYVRKLLEDAGHCFHAALRAHLH